MTLHSLVRQFFEVAPPNSKGYRPDIDGLRAIAVLAVIAYHYEPGRFPGGFIGVDIFFVISGYLITGILVKTFEAHTFSLWAFYQRRILRIFPALILVLASCLLASQFLLFPSEFQQLAKHTVAGAGFIQNLVLWREAGYFDTAAAQKPLLHLWSLAVEEQFYIFWPLTLWLVIRLRWSLMVSIVTISGLSFALNLWGIWHGHSTAAFYLPFTRAWELLAGGWLAIGHRRNLAWLYRHAPFQSWFGLGFIGIGMALIHPSSDFPGFWALFPVLGTAFIINAGPNTFLNRRLLSSGPAIWVGLFSYPLYLWHWPLLSLANIVEGGTPNASIRLSAVILSFVLAWGTYRLIEKPIRTSSSPKLITGTLVAAMIVIGAIGFGLYKKTITNNIEYESKQIAGFELFNKNISDKTDYQKIALMLKQAKKNCDAHFPEWSSITDNPCLFKKPKQNTIAIVGDSHARQLFVGLSESMSPKEGVIALSASCAAPFIGISTGLRSKAARHVRENAFLLIGRAYEYIINDPNIKVVILAHSPGCSYHDTIDIENPHVKGPYNALEAGMRRSIEALKRAGKKIIIVLDNPFLPYDPKKCLPRPFRFTQDNETCSFSRSVLDNNPAFTSYKSIVEKVLKNEPSIDIVDLSRLLCDKITCYISKQGVILYSDASHLNWDGSRLVAKNLLDIIFSKSQ